LHVLLRSGLHFTLPLVHFVEPTTAFSFKKTVLQQLLLKQRFPMFCHLHDFLLSVQVVSLLQEEPIFFQNFKK